MSVELQKQITSYVNWTLKAVVGIAVWFAVMVFNDMKSDIKTISTDVQRIEKVIIHLDDRTERNTDDIKELKNEANRQSK